MGIKLTRDMAAALRAAGIRLDAPEGRPRRTTRKLPGHCQLADGPGPGRYEVTVRGWTPWPLNKLKSAHWAVERKMKYSDACIIGRELRLAGVPRASGKRRVGLVIVLGPGQRACDPDAYDKSSHDGLKRCGAVVDDNRQWLESMPVRYERQSVISTRIILEDL